MAGILRRLVSCFFPHEKTDVEREVVATESRGGKSDAAKLALENPPSCIAIFNLAAVERGGDLDICARFQLACKKCGSPSFQILCYPVVVKEEGIYAGKEVGDVVERDPHHVKCAQCGERHVVFDSSKHGYDGALGNGSSYEAGSGKQKPIQCNLDRYQVEVVFTYNVDLEELTEIASDEGLKPQDLFDWLHIVAVDGEGREIREIDYECA
jgi:hypothetical protein